MRSEARLALPDNTGQYHPISSFCESCEQPMPSGHIDCSCPQNHPDGCKRRSYKDATLLLVEAIDILRQLHAQASGTSLPRASGLEYIVSLGNRHEDICDLLESAQDITHWKYFAGESGLSPQHDTYQLKHGDGCR
jgi:hypothetical protein